MIIEYLFIITILPLCKITQYVLYLKPTHGNLTGLILHRLFSKQENTHLENLLYHHIILYNKISTYGHPSPASVLYIKVSTYWKTKQKKKSTNFPPRQKLHNDTKNTETRTPKTPIHHSQTSKNQLAPTSNKTETSDPSTTCPPPASALCTKPRRQMTTCAAPLPGTLSSNKFVVHTFH